MKNILILIIFFQAICNVNAQTFSWNLTPIATKPISKETLSTAKKMKDINPGFPASWINFYISVQLMATCDGIIKKAVSNDDVLNDVQKNILNAADIGTDIEVEIKYNPKNSLNDTKDIKEIKFKYSIIPEVEAQFPGGEEIMKLYLDENAISKIPSYLADQINFVDVIFTIDKEGKTKNVELKSSSEFENINKIIYDTISNMPKWIPAEDANGNKVKSMFRFMAGKNLGC